MLPIYEYNGTLAGNLLENTDVINALTSSETTKPLSASQGKALNDKLNNVSKLGTVVGIGQVQCLYQDANTLKATVTFSGVPLNKEDYLCFLNLQGITGTPYNQTTAISYSFSGSIMTIEVRGAGFVSGHILVTNYLLLKVGD